jgi:hypothetical protein
MFGFCRRRRERAEHRKNLSDEDKMLVIYFIELNSVEYNYIDCYPDDLRHLRALQYLGRIDLGLDPRTGLLANK